MISPHQFDELEQQGFTVLRGVVSDRLIARFEQQIAALVDAQTRALGITPVRPDPFVDLFSVGGDYTEQLYSLMERMAVLGEMADTIGQAAERGGFFRHFGIEVPLVWPDIRADLPHTTRLLPVHQDYKSTRCRRAFRFWVPLRPSDEFRGTMCAWAGSHVNGPVPHEAIGWKTPAIAPELYEGLERVVFDIPAGDCVLFNSMLFHASVPNRSDVTKFTLMVQIQDLASMSDPRGETFASFHQALSRRDAVQGYGTETLGAEIR
jgi:hypothetical protein